ncbi:MAG: class IIb bacteriocin, lactobin A/cerein 7B family [Gemmatimonadota bacterium]|jgi:lactobin A/cerein 7B family class IIb bacteriocin|nr:class IIb bacteriocin, lactobin A/cerein 7B family [Gemmatimonadota bacterium]
MNGNTATAMAVDFNVMNVQPLEERELLAINGGMAPLPAALLLLGVSLGVAALGVAVGVGVYYIATR